MQRSSFILSLALAATLAGTLAAAAVLWRPGLEAVDGDTLRHGFWTWRLAGFDAPEIHNAKCPEERARGELAKARLIAMIQEAGDRWQLVPAAGRAKDQYGRRLARLELDGIDAGEILIVEHLAQDYDGGQRPGWCGLWLAN